METLSIMIQAAGALCIWLLAITGTVTALNKLNVHFNVSDLEYFVLGVITGLAGSLIVFGVVIYNSAL